ncbi:MAG: phosphoribosyltransferase, partial [Acidimicrobiia bacterium]|nr:phosphoribosyltransferase [Acidimicrobiia bacterium]
MGSRGLLPTRCAGCGRVGAVVCERCQCAFAEALPLPAAVRPAVALGDQRGALRRCVLALK